MLLINEISVIHQSAESVIRTKVDIVKAHDCELKVETKEGEGTTFSITLKTKG